MSLFVSGFACHCLVLSRTCAHVPSSSHQFVALWCTLICKINAFDIMADIPLGMSEWLPFCFAHWLHYSTASCHLFCLFDQKGIFVFLQWSPILLAASANHLVTYTFTCLTFVDWNSPRLHSTSFMFTGHDTSSIWAAPAALWKLVIAWMRDTSFSMSH